MLGLDGGDVRASMAWTRVSCPSTTIDRMLAMHLNTLRTQVFDVDPDTKGVQGANTTGDKAPFECVLVLVLTAEVPGVPPRAHFETPRAF